MVVLLVLVLVLAACAGEKQPVAEDLDGKALVEERCTVCHDLQRVESASKSREGWQSNVERMIDTGAQLNDAEKDAVIEYLTEAYPE
jgi:hypothetical protein